ncbi:hypothetical protein HJFPF1_08971 [Paramyrothecium foliicola]|nr:hypothetical protein HJFPF1_08971 [Paramyrothecium foliicola]
MGTAEVNDEFADADNRHYPNAAGCIIEKNLTLRNKNIFWLIADECQEAVMIGMGPPYPGTLAVANEHRHGVLERIAAFIDEFRFHLTDPEMLYIIHAAARATKLGLANGKNPASNTLIKDFSRDCCFIRVVLVVIVYGPERLRGGRKDSSVRRQVEEWYPGWDFLDIWFPPQIYKKCPWAIFGRKGDVQVKFPQAWWYTLYQMAIILKQQFPGQWLVAIGHGLASTKQSS